MDACSFNWELAAKFVPLIGIVAPIVAIYIFRQWNKQKGREVIANEAKKLLDNLNNLKIERNKLANYMHIKDINLTQSQIKIFTKCNSNIIPEIDTFLNLINKIKMENENIKYERNAVYDLYIKLSLSIIKIEDFNKIKTNGVEYDIKERLKKYKESNIKLIDEISYYALYQEPPKDDKSA